MEHTFRITKASRNIIKDFLDKYTLEQLNTIPEGFKNNLIWNIAHIVVVQQMLVYKLSGLPMMISDDMVEKFKKGEKPEHIVTQAEVDEIKTLLGTTIEKTEIDYNNKVFKNYLEYPTSTGFVIKNADDAMAFNYFHEGLHIGIMMGIRKLI
ncbi:DinB family protein [Flavobacterium cellulosilyticum]|uniref:DinB family protein n=1 Tax=Flavobacterium cellulosilyticum TaxID=2541731 RepID=A0A4R5CQC2_9FLAO|nr:DinB family protein [Flavobacterium cellulosilyticum]TDD99802.1 DinB family protein [Flavobacterium cellulosilyticum]